VAIKVRDSGRYELVEDEHGHRFLVLGKRWYVWIKGRKSPILVRTDSGHRRQRVLQRGRYLHVDFEDDPKFRDMPHVFLEKGDQYEELVLPNGFPTLADPQKRLVVSRKTLPKSELDDYLGRASARTRRRFASPRPTR
jgi:hypothetical protein